MRSLHHVDTERGFTEGAHGSTLLSATVTDLLTPQLLQEVETQAILSQQKIQQTQGEINAKKREARLNQLTSNELATLSKDTNIYEGVGKM